MSHEPECPFREWPEETCYQKDAGIDCCTIASAAYQRGREDAAEAVDDMLFSDARGTMRRRDFLARVRGDGEQA